MCLGSLILCFSGSATAMLSWFESSVVLRNHGFSDKAKQLYCLVGMDATYWRLPIAQAHHKIPLIRPTVILPFSDEHLMSFNLSFVSNK